MSAFKGITVTRVKPDAWDYLIEIEDDRGGKTRLTAGLEDLDVIAAALEQKLEEMIDAAERLGMER